jgi:type IV pilus assembly protein PilQ
MAVTLCPSAARAADEDTGAGEKTASDEKGDEKKDDEDKDNGKKDASETTSAELVVTVGEEGASLFAVNADAHKTLTELAKKTGLHLIVDDTIKRKLTLNLTNRTGEQILEQITDACGLACSEVDGIWLVSEGIPKNPSTYLLSEIDTITTKYVQAPNAKSLLPVFLQDHVKINPGQNSVILSGPPAVLRKFREDISQFDIPAAQIMIEVLVVEFTDMTRDEFDAAVGLIDSEQGGVVDSLLGTLTFSSIAGLPDDFYINLKALVTKGRARVRANPRIATVSGQKAEIFIGQQQYLSTPVTLSDERSTNSIDAGVSLEMTPYTGGEGEIIAEIKPEISTLTAPDPTTGLPDKTTRRAETTLRVQDGETIIIGGLTQIETRETRGKIPVIGDLPLVGGLFRSKNVDQIKTELVIFITPRTLSLTGHLPEEEEARLREHFLPAQKEAQP